MINLKMLGRIKEKLKQKINNRDARLKLYYISNYVNLKYSKHFN